ncbi:unnamed protein product [Caenorhabditis nigoni]
MHPYLMEILAIFLKSTYLRTEPTDLIEYHSIDVTFGDEHSGSCPSGNLDNSNIKSFLNPINPFYKTITSLNLKSPVFTKNECEGSMYCDNQEDDLLVFDSTGLGKIFRGEQVHGICNQSTEAWDVDTGNGPEILTFFKELYGTCIKLEIEIQETSGYRKMENPGR